MTDAHESTTPTHRPTSEEIASRLAAADIAADTATVVAEKSGPFDVVYRVSVDNDDLPAELYVRTVRGERAQTVREVLGRVDIETPTTSVLDGTPSLLVSHPARGRPLSTVLPFALLPGIWRLQRAGLESAFATIGETVGTLHAATRRESVPVATIAPHDQRLEEVRASLEHLGLGSAVTATVRERLERLGGVEFAVATSHCDLSPHNIYYCGGDVDLIDVAFADRLFASDLVKADIGVTLMTGRLPYARDGQRRRLLEAFWAGYDSTGIPVDPRATAYRSLRLYYYCHMLNRYVEDDGLKRGFQLTKWTDGRLIRRIVRRECEQ
ncbi:aminoglycoside phosphotransferase/kinase family protein [Natronobiforma cellulositropha]|uniref:hypothetical protein n=1 Tax=Natronobiforma cellulositropha TaxID=1679076 RepID=UPI0021D5DE3B|nr:hypothetical protein [Natronobiforma cellulositropha]